MEKKNDNAITIRLPNDLYEILQEYASKNERSLNKEITWRLRNSFSGLLTTQAKRQKEKQK